MKNAQDLLQARLEQLESGKSLEVCLEGLPEPEAEALRLAASLLEVAYPERNRQVIASQRQATLIAASEVVSLDGRPQIEGDWSQTVGSWIDKARQGLDWLLTRKALSTGMLSLFVLVLFVLAWAGLRALRPSADEPIRRITTTNGQGPSSPAGDQAVAPEAPAGISALDGHEIFLPVLQVPLDRAPQKAVLEKIHGIVEVQGLDGVWMTARWPVSVSQGQKVRTTDLSGATLVFYDGSRVKLGPNTEISLDELDARRPKDGPRKVILTQTIGESEHRVRSRDGSRSVYEVKTPAGSAVAKGTEFQIQVTADLRARIAVTDGEVDVSNLSQSVSLIAGQLTTLVAGRPPEEPVFRITGEGEVSQIGPVWIIAGQSFQVHEQTLILGDPRVGDLVLVEGHLAPDGERVADRIVLLRRALSNRFSLTGIVESIGDEAWTIAGQTVLITEQTDIDEGIQVGDTVQVDGVILAGGSLVAEQILRQEDAPGFPFHFIGLVQAVGAAEWTISGQVVAVDEFTEIGGGIAVGDLVDVQGWILDDGTWLARAIDSHEDEENEWSIVGQVESLDPWIVAGIPFEVREWTVIEPGIAVGDLVRVRGTILADGTLVATTIERLFDLPGPNTIVFFGVVGSIDPWVVSGIPLVVDGDTVILGEVSIGSLVRVEIELMADGTWRVVSIQALADGFGLGCFSINTEVIRANASQIILENLMPISRDGSIEIEGDLHEGTVVTVYVCVLEDGTIIVVTIVVIHQPVIILPPPPPPANGNENDNGNHNHNDNHNHNG